MKRNLVALEALIPQSRFFSAFLIVFMKGGKVDRRMVELWTKIFDYAVILRYYYYLQSAIHVRLFCKYTSAAPRYTHSLTLSFAGLGPWDLVFH